MIELDPQWLTQLLTSLGVLITAVVSVWNAWQASKTNTKLDETTQELKALRATKKK